MSPCRFPSAPVARSSLAAIGLCLSLGACATPDFVCEHDRECIAEDGRQGVCEPTRRCSFPDQACAETGRRYAELSGDRGEDCVAGDEIAYRGAVVAGRTSAELASGAFSLDLSSLPELEQGRARLYVLVVASEAIFPVAEVTSASSAWVQVDKQCAARQSNGMSLWRLPAPGDGTEAITIALADTSENTVAALLAFDVLESRTTVTLSGRANTLGDAAACPNDGSEEDSAAFGLDVGARHAAGYPLLAISSRGRTAFAETGASELKKVSVGEAGDVVTLTVFSHGAEALADGVASGTLSGIVDWAAMAAEVF